MSEEVFGAFATHKVVQASTLTKMPEGMSSRAKLTSMMSLVDNEKTVLT